MSKIFLGLLLALVLSSCQIFQAEQLPNPQAIVVRNLSGTDLNLVTLAADQVARGERRRFGAVSPVLNGTSQVTERGPSAPPLPQHIELAWEERSGREYRRSVDLEPVLLQAKGLAEFSLVFEIHPLGDLKVLAAALP